MAQPLNKGTTMSGPLRIRTAEQDGELFVPAREFNFLSGTWLYTRSAIGNYFFRRTAGASSDAAVLNLTQAVLKKIGSDPTEDIYDGPSAAAQYIPDYIAKAADQGNYLGSPTARVRGFQITAIDVIYGIATDALAAHTLSLRQTTYANNVAPSVATPSATTGSLATATQALPYLSTITVTTPYIIGGNTTRVADWLEINADATGHATAVYDFYGVAIKFNYNLL